MLRCALIILLLPLAVLAGGDNCETRDYRAEAGPARNQGISMWCYAHSAADLVSQKLRTQVSAFDLAAAYLLEDENEVKKSSDPVIANYLKKDKNFFSRLKRWRNDEPQSYRPERILGEKGLYFLGGMDQDAILLSHAKGYCTEKNLPGGTENLESYLTEINGYAVKKCGGDLQHCRFIPPVKIGEIKNAKSRALAKIFKNWVDEKCRHRIKPAVPYTADVLDFAEGLDEFNLRLKKGEISRDQVRLTLGRFIDRELDSGNIVAIGYDLLDVAPVEFAVGPGADDKTVDHSSVIAARRMINGQCRYFVRTHLGSECGYRNGLNRFCETSEGGLWVTLKELPSLYSVLKIR